VKRWRGPNGIQVEVIMLDSGPMLKITQTVNGHRYINGYARTIADLTKHVDLADLVEVVDFPT